MAMMSLTLSAHSSHLRTSHLAGGARSTSLPYPRILPTRYRSRSAVHPVPCAPRLLLLPTSSSDGRKICGSNGELPLGGGGCGGGGSSSGKPGSGDADDKSGEGFRGLNHVLKWIRRLLGVLKQPLLAGDFLATMNSSISISSEEVQSLSSSHSSDSTHETIQMGDEESHYNGSINDQLTVIMPPRDNHSERSSRTSSNRNNYSNMTAEMRTRTTNSQDHHVDMDISGDGTEGRRSYGSNIANSSFLGALALLPYWGLCCSDLTRSIWTDALVIADIFVIFITIILSGQFSRYKDGKLPIDALFKLLEIVQLIVLLCLCVGAFSPQHICRGVSNWVIWPATAVALFLIVITWGSDFQKKTVIKCIKAPCQMVIKCMKVMYEKIWQWPPDLSLPECIKFKLKKMPQEQRDPGVSMDMV